jgi:hypothetical protein
VGETIPAIPSPGKSAARRAAKPLLVLTFESMTILLE